MGLEPTTLYTLDRALYQLSYMYIYMHACTVHVHCSCTRVNCFFSLTMYLYVVCVCVCVAATTSAVCLLLPHRRVLQLSPLRYVPHGLAPSLPSTHCTITCSRLGIQVSLAIICLFVWAMVGWVTLPFFSFLFL